MGEVIEATIDDGRPTAIAIAFADMLEIVYGAAAQAGIDRTDLTNLKMQRFTTYGGYTDRTTD